MENLFTPELINALVSFLIVLLGFATFRLTQYMSQKGYGEKMTNALWEVQEIIGSAVHEAEAVAVREAKAGGTWDKARQDRVKKEVLDKVSNSLSTNTSKFLIARFGDLNEWLSGQIERQVVENKVNGAK
jgi:hypothetical protein